MDYSFRLLFTFVSMCCHQGLTSTFLMVFFSPSRAHVCTWTQHDDAFHKEVYQSSSRLENADEKNSKKTRETVSTKGTDTFSPSRQLLSQTLTPIWHHGDSPVLCGSTQGWYRYACKGRDLNAFLQLTRSGFHFGPRAMWFIESRLHGVLLGKPQHFILPASSDFIVEAPWHAASSSHVADRQACLHPSWLELALEGK